MSEPSATSEYVVIERAALEVLTDWLDRPHDELVAAAEVADRALTAEGSEYRRFHLAGSKTQTFVLDRQVGTLGLAPEISSVVAATCDYPLEAVRMMAVLETHAGEYDRADPNYPSGIPAAASFDEEPF